MNTTGIHLDSMVQIRINGRVGVVRGIYQGVGGPPSFHVRYSDANQTVRVGWFQADELIPNATAPASMARG
jgi:hypothetical protein